MLILQHVAGFAVWALTVLIDGLEPLPLFDGHRFSLAFPYSFALENCLVARLIALRGGLFC